MTIPSDKQLLAPALRPGDLVRAVSPSSTIAGMEAEMRSAAQAFGERLDVRVEFAEHAFATHHYSAGTPAERADDFMAAFADPDVAAVVLSMGGATAIDVLDLLDYDTIAANPKILTGISDSTTVLQAVTARTGLVTFHGIELYDYSRDPMPYTTANALNVWRDGWHGPWPENPAWRELNGETTTYTHRRTIRGGTATGPLAGGNSEAVTQLIGTPYEPDVDGAILVLETYRLHKRHIHALLVSLRQRGWLHRASGLVLGYLLGSEADRPGDDRDLADLVTEVTAGVPDLPVAQIGEIGHQVENLVLPLGATAHLDAAGPVPGLTLTGPAVQV
jgi:muramoyltetrapeptide carboxypeptidase